MSTGTCFGYINSDHWGEQKKKKKFDIQLQKVVRDLKLYNGFITKLV